MFHVERKPKKNKMETKKFVPEPEPIGQRPIVQCNACKHVEYGEPAESEQELLHRLRDDRFWDLEGDTPTCSRCEIAADATGGIRF